MDFLPARSEERPISNNSAPQTASATTWLPEALDLDGLLSRGLNVLAFDLSVSSTGVAWVLGGELFADNIFLKDLCTSKEGSPLYDAYLRRELYNRLRDELSGFRFDAVIVEDVYFGSNPKTYRQLLSLNTVPDELVIDSVIEAENFLRIQNKVWKSWLKPLIPEVRPGHTKDKEYVRLAMSSLGIEQTGSGGQDRMDSMSMALGWVLHTGTESRSGSFDPVDLVKEKPQVYWKDVEWWVSDVAGAGQEISLGNLSKSKVLSFLRSLSESERVGVSFHTRPGSLGLLGAELGIPASRAELVFNFKLK